MSRHYLIHGASVIVYVNGQRFGQVLSMDFNSQNPRQVIRGLDSVTAFELAPTTVDVMESLTIYRQGQDGGAEGAAITVPIADLTRENYFSLALVEESSNTVLFQASRCAIEGQQWGAQARGGHVMGTISFRAIEWTNEVRSVPQP